jgi:hypothetical protein
MALFSKSRWRWTWWFLLLCVAAALLYLLGMLLGGLFGPDGGPMYYVELLALAGFGVGIVGTVISIVVTLVRGRSRPSEPVV